MGWRGGAGGRGALSPLGTLVSFHSPKACRLGEELATLSHMCACLSLCVSPVISWQLAQDVSRLSLMKSAGLGGIVDGYMDK